MFCQRNSAHSSLALEKILSCFLIVKLRARKNEKEFIVKRCFLGKKYPIQKQHVGIQSVIGL